MNIDQWLSAREVLTNPYVKDLLDKMEHDYMQMWSNCTDIDGREKFYYLLQGLRSFRTELESRSLTARLGK